MKHCLIAIGLCLAVPASAATDDGSLACRLVDKSLVARMSGDAIRALEPQALNICAGLCPSVNGSSCSVSLLSDSSGHNSWTIWVYQPPFYPLDWIGAVSDDRAQREMIPWRDARAVWNYRADQKRGILTVWTNNHKVMVLVTREHDASQGSLSAARAIAARALVLFKSQK